MTDIQNGLSPSPEGVLIARVRGSLGLSYEATAERARGEDVKPSTVRHIETGKIKHSRSRTVAAICLGLGISAEQLAGEGERPDAAGVLEKFMQMRIQDTGLPSQQLARLSAELGRLVDEVRDLETRLGFGAQ